MSTWKKSLKSGQREHRERHQPKERAHLGLLEKKKDYKLRARAYKLKQNKLKKLQKQAFTRNPDEFCFHMINSEIKDGLHFEKEKTPENNEAQLKLINSQNINYINFKLSTELKKIENLKSELQLLEIEDKPKNTHTFYADSSSEAKKYNFAKKLKTLPELLDRTYNRLTLDLLKKTEMNYDSDIIEKSSKLLQQKYNELSKRIQRAQELQIISQKLDLKKKLLNKNDPPAKIIKEKTKISDSIYVWKKERKR